MKVKYATSKIDDGNMSFSFGKPNEVISNRERFLAKDGLSIKDMVALYNQHKDDIVVVDSCFKGQGALTQENALPYDAIITNEPGVVLFLLIADCIPAVVYDPVIGVVALVHLGWKGVNLGLGPKVIRLMNERFGCEPVNLKVDIGPHIQKESYFYEDVEAFNNPGWKEFLNRKDDLWQIDNTGFAVQQFVNAGIAPDNIAISPIDTAKDLSYFSHYRSTKNGDPEGRIATYATVMQ